MNSKNTPPHVVKRLNFLSPIGVFIIFAAIVAMPLYSVRSSALPKGRAPISSEGISALRSTISFPLLVPQAIGSPSVATFDGTNGTTCQPAKTEFNLGQNVCATATNTGGAIARRRFSWADPEGFVRQQTSITTDPQNDHFTIPATPTSTLSNGQVVKNVGNWRVNIISSRGALVTFATFVVKDPSNATADLSVFKKAPSNSEQVPAGSNGSFDIFVQNSGPDDAATVTLTDHVPDHTTFVSMIQTSGPAFTCTNVPDGSGNITCSIATLAAGASATFDFVYTVNAGTPAGTLITNTASISSATNELNGADNSATASASVAAGGGAGTCTLTCPGNITTPADTTENGQPGAIVHFDPPTAQGTSCGTIAVDHCNDCFFPVGTTVVSATENGTTGDSCSFTVTVNEAGAPTITCPPNKTANADSNCEATVDPGSPTTTGSDVTVTGSRSDGRPLSDPFPAGTTTITWTASNSSGTVSCQQTVTVSDTTAPTITCPANITTGNDAGQCSATVNPGTATATDNCDSSPTVTGSRSDGQALNAPYPKGTTTITWTATDNSGNSSSCTQTVTVNDNEPPKITCPANITTFNDPGQCSANVNPGTATATDNCGSTTVSGTRSDGRPLSDPYPVGVTTITWTATDSSGNSSSCTQTITVNDTEAPTITCPANITQASDPGSCSANVNPGTATAMDNCGTPTVTSTRSDNNSLSSPFPVGTTTITWTATDSSGNSSSCTQTVTVTKDVSISANFDGTSIQANTYIWFNSILKPSGLGSSAVTIRFFHQKITSSQFNLTLPDAKVIFDPNATTATTSFTGGEWVTRVPSSGLAGNTFLSGLSYLVPSNLPGGIQNVTWSGTFISDTPGVTLDWKWAAAVYSHFSTDNNLLQIKPVDDNHASQYQNSDHAGTPEAFKQHYVIGGARGGGGSNYTGSYSGTLNVTPCTGP